MPKRSSKEAEIVNQPAEGTVQKPTAEPLPDAAQASTEVPSGGKNPAAVALGRLGGLKGGPARAAKLTKEERSQIAAHAASARWARQKRNGNGTQGETGPL